MKMDQGQQPGASGGSDAELVEKIRQVIARGNHAEIKGATDGSLRVYEVKKIIQQ